MATSTKPPAVPTAKQTPKAHPEQSCPLWAAYQRDKTNDALRNQLVERYLHIVRYQADRMANRLPDSVDPDDLFSAGCFGLMDAIGAFNLCRGVKFETYCVPRIRGAMLDELRKMDWVPRLVRSRANQLKVAFELLEARHGRAPTERELSRHLDVPIESVREMAASAQIVETASLYALWCYGDGGQPIEIVQAISDRSAELPYERLAYTELLRTLLKGCNQDERLILLGYYEIGDTMKQIGQSLGLSQSRVSQIHSALIGRLQERRGDGCGQAKARSA